MKTMTASETRDRLRSPAEIAVIDVREFGQYGEGHPFFAVNVPYSQLEPLASRLLPRHSAPIVLCDGGDGIAERAASRLHQLGYDQIFLLEGGVPAWVTEGHRLHRGVNLPSKTLGEMVENTLGTPRLPVDDFLDMRRAGRPILLLDGRTEAEHRRFTIPGSLSCPNAELGLRLPDTLDPDTMIVMHCAGRTRSIIGAETLRALGTPYPVAALENGTQGWQLAGYERECGANRVLADRMTPNMRSRALRRAASFCRDHRISRVDTATLSAWRRDAMRTLYLFDVRTAEEYRGATVPGAVHAPGGQLIQATDHWLAVRGARVVVWDDSEIRAASTAYWLRAMGWDTAMLVGPVEAAAPDRKEPNRTAVIEVEGLFRAVEHGMRLVDVRSSSEFRLAHVRGATWSIRPSLGTLSGVVDGRFVVIGNSIEVARLAACELLGHGAAEARIHVGSPGLWRQNGLPLASSPDDPPDAARIDHLFFTAERHSGNLDHARQYLAWEQQLPARLHAYERAAYRLETLRSP